MLAMCEGFEWITAKYITFRNAFPLLKEVS